MLEKSDLLASADVARGTLQKHPQLRFYSTGDLSRLDSALKRWLQLDTQSQALA